MAAFNASDCQHSDMPLRHLAGLKNNINEPSRAERSTPTSVLSEPPQKKLKYIPSDPDGGGRFVNENETEFPVNDTQIHVGGARPENYKFVGPQGQTRRENAAMGLVPVVYAGPTRDSPSARPQDFWPPLLKSPSRGRGISAKASTQARNRSSLIAEVPTTLRVSPVVSNDNMIISSASSSPKPTSVVPNPILQWYTDSDGPWLPRAPKVPTKLKCPYCSRHYSRSDKLRVHLRTHTDVQSFFCPECDKRFTQQQYMKRHHNIFHRPLANSRISAQESLDSDLHVMDDIRKDSNVATLGKHSKEPSQEFEDERLGNIQQRTPSWEDSLNVKGRWHTAKTFIAISSTISKDNTLGDEVRNGQLLAEFARKSQRLPTAAQNNPTNPESAAKSSAFSAHMHSTPMPSHQLQNQTVAAARDTVNAINKLRNRESSYETSRIKVPSVTDLWIMHQRIHRGTIVSISIY